MTGSGRPDRHLPEANPPGAADECDCAPQIADMVLPHRWLVTDEEDAAEYGCDRIFRPGGDRLLRGVSVAAPPETVFAWLGNLRVAPYSYDWIDNFGRRSPTELRSELPPLAVGDRIMTIFTAVSVEPGRELTVRMHPGPGRTLFGDVAVTYAVRPVRGGCRLLAVVLLENRRGPWPTARRHLLRWGDLLMMEKQLRTIRDLAQRDTRGAR